MPAVEGNGLQNAARHNPTALHVVLDVVSVGFGGDPLQYPNACIELENDEVKFGNNKTANSLSHHCRMSERFSHTTTVP